MYRGDEQDELAMIEDQLKKSDPWLEEYMTRPRAVRLRRNRVGFLLLALLGTAMTLFAVSLLWGDATLLAVCGLVLALTPACLTLAAASTPGLRTD